MAKLLTIVSNGITFNIKAGQTSKSFTDLVEKYLKPAMIKHYLKETGRMQYDIQHIGQGCSWQKTSIDHSELRLAIKDALEFSNQVSGIVRVYDYVAQNFVAHFENGLVIKVAKDHEMDVLNAIEAETAEILSGAIEANNLGELTREPTTATLDVTFEQNPTNKVYIGTCPDCKDGFYYPLFGPKEPCRTCHASHQN